MTIAGGLNTDPTVVEKETLARVIRLGLVAAFTAIPALSAVSSQYQSIPAATPPNVSQPAVETYVLNSTFLI